MSFLPGEKLQYAETHFKFKLPWSLLYRPWPEILVDAPFQFIPGSTPSLWIVVRDAHRFPTRIEKLHVEIEKACDARDPQGTQVFDIDLNIDANQQFAFYPVTLGNLAPGKYSVHCKVTASRNGTTREFTRWNYPGLKPGPLRIHVLSEALPKPEGYIVGETHCHTHYSADHVEHGASPAVFKAVAKAIGLDFVSITDHAYDFAFFTEDYTQEATSPLPRFNALRKEVEECNSSKDDFGEIGTPLLIAGEEVSVGNSKGENVHMTVLGPSGYLPGLGDCGRNWLDNKPTLKIAQALSMTEVPCFAAHPHQQMGYLEKFVFRRGYWKSEDLNTGSKHPIRGIQFWNGLRDEGFWLGREWWIQELGKENYVLPIGGNDAHGDLNETTAVDLPLVSLKHNRHHVFGKVRTGVKLPPNFGTSAKALTCEMVQQAFQGDNCYITDGPALWWERVFDSSHKNTGLTVHARSNADLGGGFRYVKIFGRRRLNSGKLAPKEELHLNSLIATTATVDISVDFENYAYLRAECETATGRFALTSAAKNNNS